MTRGWLLASVLTMMGLMGCATDVDDPIDPPPPIKTSNPRPEQALSAPNVQVPSYFKESLEVDSPLPAQVLQKPELPTPAR